MAGPARRDATVIVVGGGIGGMAAALALSQTGYQVEVLEQAPEIGEIGAGIQLGPNAFAACDALGVGERMRGRAVYTDELVMMDAVDGKPVIRMPVGQEFREFYGNPYAVIHRVDMHSSVYETVQSDPNVKVHTSTRITGVDIGDGKVRVTAQNGAIFEGDALIGADGVKSVVRQTLVGDSHRVSGHVVYRAVLSREEMPAEMRWNAAAIWVGPNCHVVHYPLRGGEQFNLVVTFHSRGTEEWSVREGSKEEVHSYFTHICDAPRQLIDKAETWRRWATADRDPVAAWGHGPTTLLGDAAHPTLQYLAQGACMALEDAVTLREAIKAKDGSLEAAFRLYEEKRIPRTARVVLTAREMGRAYHAQGVERLVRNDMFKNLPPRRAYEAMSWLYGWTIEKALA